MKNTVFNIFCISCVVLFTYLGMWQVDRMRWKQSLIAQTEKYRDAAPVEFSYENYDVKRDLFKKVFFHGKFLHDKEILLTAKYRDGERDKAELGFHVITPYLTTEGIIIFVNRGWIPEKYKIQSTRPQSLYEGNIETAILGMMRENQGNAPWYMPQNLPEKNIWFWIDMPAMIKALQDRYSLENIHSVLVQQTNLTTANNFPYPEPLNDDIVFYNQHLSYVITWFAMALVILVMWLYYMRSRKRQRG